MIKRYFAIKDNTITNAFDRSLVTRGTGSNMGQADILEVFTIYAQVSNSSGLSSEKSRAIIQFDLNEITADSNPTGTKYFLKMYNAKHPFTLPRDFSMQVLALSAAWQEGRGLDMDNYSDLTYDNTGSNWINAQKPTAATATITAATPGSLSNGATFTLTNAAGTTTTYRINSGGAFGTQAGGAAGSTIDMFIGGAGTVAHIAEAVRKVITATTNADMTATDNGTNVTVTQTTLGTAGNRTNTNSGTGLASVGNFAGAVGEWAEQGGSTHASPIFSANFEVGDEDLEVDVTTLVDQWIAGTKENYGFMIKMSSNIEDSSESFFTKKFFSRSTEFYFSRPVLEARFDDSKLDDRGQFLLSSSLAPGIDNLNTIYLYNYVRGRLRNIPSIGTGKIGVSLFSSSNGQPVGNRFKLVTDGANVRTDNPYVVTGGYVSPGIYSASVAFTGSSTLETMHDVWFKLNNTVLSAQTSTNQFTTGTISPKTLSALPYSDTGRYIFSVSNRNNTYACDQIHRIRLYAREKDWSPNIFTVATGVPDPIVFASASYQIHRTVDDLVVVPYGTGSTQHTRLSYDVSGSYFDLDTSILEPNYIYEAKISIYDPDVDSYEEQPFSYKFRVVKNEY